MAFLHHSTGHYLRQYRRRHPATGGINVISPTGLLVERITLPAPYTTNIAFAGADMRVAYVILSGTGRLVRMDWARPGLRLFCG